MNQYRSIVTHYASLAGLKINNKNGDIQVNNPLFFKRAITEGSLGLGESYVDGWWSSLKLDEVLYKLIKANIAEQIKPSPKLLWQTLLAQITNRQSIKRATQVAKVHYNIGNDLFEKMLGKHLMYSCGYWKNATNLDEAQAHKLELICKKLKLTPGMQILDIGCGWGTFAKYAAEKYNVSVVGITIAEEQAKMAREKCKNLPIHIKVEDYRALNQQFDRIVSIGMFEHVGYKNYAKFMDIVHRCLKKSGLFLLHCIGSDKSHIQTDPWINTYIFPNGMIPAVAQIGTAIEPYFKLQDWHNFGHDYDLTLMAWLHNFKQAWPELRQTYGDRFYKLWEYYLCLSAASFRAGTNNLWQIVLTHQDYPENYKAER